MTSTIYDSIAQDPFIQQAKYQLEEIDEQITRINRLSLQTIEDKVRKDALINKWATLKTQYDRAIKTLLESAGA